MMTHYKTGKFVPPEKKGRSPLALYQSGGAKAIVTDVGRIAFGASQNCVVKEGNIDGAGGFPKLPGHVKVRGARGGIAAGVIMDADDRRCTGDHLRP